MLLIYSLVLKCEEELKTFTVNYHVFAVQLLNLKKKRVGCSNIDIV